MSNKNIISYQDERNLLSHLFGGIILMVTVIGFLFGAACIIAGIQEYVQSKIKKADIEEKHNEILMSRK